MAEMISFPPGVLGQEAVRLAMLMRSDGLYALAKPAGCVVSADPLYEGVPELVAAINDAAAAGKPQLAALEIAGAFRIHTLDAEMTGAVVLAGDEKSAAAARNDLGSKKWEFVFDLIAEAREGAAFEPVECALPLAHHTHQHRMIVSRQTGKRCATRFTPVKRFGRHGHWEAHTRELRTHQVRVHAAECGLRIPGESLYSRVRLVYLSSLKRGFRAGREEERPLHEPLAVHLRCIRIPGLSGKPIVIEAARPRSFSALLKRLEAHG